MLREVVGGEDVESVTLRLANLEISISVRQIDGTPSLATDFELVSSPGEPGPSVDRVDSVVDRYGISLSLENQAIQAQLPSELAALPLAFLRHLVAKLRGQDSTWTPTARIGRAFRAGIIARRRLLLGVAWPWKQPRILDFILQHILRWGAWQWRSQGLPP